MSFVLLCVNTCSCVGIPGISEKIRKGAEALWLANAGIEERMVFLKHMH